MTLLNVNSSGEVYEEPKKHNRYFCMGCKLRKTVDYERSTLVCTKCGVFEYYPAYVSSYNHMMQPSRRKASTRDMTILRSY